MTPCLQRPCWKQSLSLFQSRLQSQLQNQMCGGNNPAYYGSQQDSNTGWSNGTSGLWVTNGGWLALYFGAGSTYSGFEMLDYTMHFEFRPLSELRGGVQNDANSSLDAGAGTPDAIHVNNFINMTTNATSGFHTRYACHVDIRAAAKRTRTSSHP